MKKKISILLVLMLILSMPLTVAAQEAALCTISADTVAAAVGETVTVPVRIQGNPGFTNFALAIKYDAEALRLERIDTVGKEEQAYLCPAAASVNTAYIAAEGETPCGFVNGAASEAVMEDGILFAATFTVLSQTSGTEEIDLELQYLRCGDVLTSIFTALTASADQGAIQVALRGDLDADDSITQTDADAVYRYINEALTLTDVQFAAADVNADGMIDTTDAALIYRVANGTLTEFPVKMIEEVAE